jgi:glycosyltransferase involved in cell wall biosynthesis
MKILCVLSWVQNGRWLWDYIPGNRDSVDCVYIEHPRDRFPAYGKLLGYYEKFWWLGLKAWPKLKHYDAIVTWEANTGLPLGFLRNLLGKRSPPLLIINFVLKGRPILDMLPLTRFALRSVNCMTCISQREIAYNAQLLRLPTSKFVKLQGPWVDNHADHAAEIYAGPHILSAGRSHRDYGTLMEAVRGLPVQTVINARAFNVEGLEPPSNVVINPFLPWDQFLTLVRTTRFTVVPLHPACHASGESFMMEGMAAGKAAIASKTFSTAELIEPGVNGILVPPEDVSALREAIQYLLDHPEQAQQMGRCARQMFEERWSFPVVARQVHEIVTRLVETGSAPSALPLLNRG